MIVTDIFARNLRKERLAKGLSQEALADKAGLHRTYVGSVERGERNITLINAEKLAHALDIELADLVRRKR
jgi:transcriptional regulator with XRE-family HTH domain